MQRAVRKYLKALEASDTDKAAALFTADGWVQSPFLGRLPVRDYMAKVAAHRVLPNSPCTMFWSAPKDTCGRSPTICTTGA